MKENEIRPKKLLDSYLKIADNDIEKYFNDSGEFRNVGCPACGSRKNTDEFVKRKFKYKRCIICKTLFVSPRPAPGLIDKYYRQSESAKFWASVFYRKTEKARRRKLFKPKARLLMKFAEEHGVNGGKFVDIGAGYGTFCEEVKRLDFMKEVYALEPSVYLAEECRKKGLEVIESTIEGIGGKYRGCFDFAVALELFEHSYSPERFMRSVRNVLRKGGYFVFTTLNGLGWDILVLGRDSKSVSPPHHLNFINPEAVEILAGRTGWEVVKVFTPGKLDVDIVYNFHKDNPGIKLDGFTEYLVSQDENKKELFQKFLVKNLMSSHLWAILKRS